MKKIIALCLILTLFLSLCACGNNANIDIDNSSVNSSDDNSINNNTPSTNLKEYEEGDIILFDDFLNLSSTDFEKYNAQLIKSLQGNITQIQSDGGDIIILTNNAVYGKKPYFLKFEEFFKLQKPAEDFQCFANTSTLTAMVSFYNDEIFVYNKNGELLNSIGIPFNAKKDTLVYADETKIKFYEKANDSYFIKYCDPNDYDSEKTLSTEKIEKFELYGGTEVSIKIDEIFCFKDYTNLGNCVYIKTANGDLYGVNDFDSNVCTFYYATQPICSNIDKIFEQHNLGNNRKTPFYNKINDLSKLYVVSMGDEFLDSSDDFEASFHIPTEHNTSEIIDIFEINDIFIFVFDNGDVYKSNSDFSKTKTEYSLEKIEDVSKLNAEGKIKTLTGCHTTVDEVLYILQTDGKIYVKEID